jgi:uncharacterized protein (TIGR03066 family)
MRSNLTAARAFVLLACVALFAAGCGSAPEDRIVGKWEAGTAPATMTAEFAKDGTATLTVLGKPVTGTYKLTGDELEWTVGGQTTRSKVKLTATGMELTSGGKTITYKKV